MLVRASLVVALLAACGDPSGPSVLPAERFGAVTALIDGHPWIASYGPDSVVAAYDTIGGQLQILGYQFRTGVDPHIDLFVRAHAGLGAYHLGNLLAPALGEWSGVMPSNRSRASVEQLQLFVSTGENVDSLIIDELSLISRLIRGRFNFTAMAVNGSLRTSLRGRFAGRIELYNGSETLLHH